MQRIIYKKLFKVAVISAFLVALIVINPNSLFDPLRSFSNVLLLPFEKVFYSFGVGYNGTMDFLGSIGNLKHENEQLVKENQQLISQNALLQGVEDENIVLREQLKLLPREKFDVIAAFVVSQDPNGMGNWIEIDKGSNQGIKKGDSVIVSKGILVGRIDQVDANTSKVILLTNPESTVNVATLKNGTKGVAKGEYGLGIVFDMILQTDSINVGEDVITSGVGGGIPGGLYVGKVQEIHPSDDHLFQQASITSPIQASKLPIVFIIKATK